MKKTLLTILFLIDLVAIGQCWEYKNIKTTHWQYELKNKVYCYAKGEKSSGYVDIMVKVNNEKIRNIGGVFILTRNGNFTKPIHSVKKNGFCVVRIYLSEIELWKCIDAGITRIDLFTNKNQHIIYILDEFNRDVQELKQYCKINQSKTF